MITDIQNPPFQIHSDAIFTQMEDQMVILNYETGIYYALNEPGVRIWQLIEQNNTLEDIIAKLLKEYRVSEEKLQHDVINLVEKLKEKGLIL
jgi:hypothetical protein